MVMPEIKVAIDIVRGKYRLRLPRKHSKSGKRFYCTGLKATEDNYPKAIELANRICSQLEKGLVPNIKEPNLGMVWEHYIEYKRPYLSVVTYNNLYKSMHSFISQLPNELPETVQRVINTKTAVMARYYLTNIKVATKYALLSGYTKQDKYKDLEVFSKRCKPEIDPFTATERSNIIMAFALHPTYSPYTSFVKFLFYSGCRIGEVVALHWEQVEARSIWINASYNSEYKTRKGTKTGKPRRIPITSQLRQILAEIPREPNSPIVFQHRLGTGYINGLQFSAIWRQVVEPLVANGEVERYRKPYNTRHTYITMLLESGLNFAEVSKLSGSSTKTIQEYYFGVTRDIVVPDI